MSHNMKTLLSTAAELRSGGHSWESVANQVRRSVKTVCQWPIRYANDWKIFYRQAQKKRHEEAASEALSCLRNLLQGEDDRVRVKAADCLLKFETIEEDEKQADYIEDDDELQKIIAEYRLQHDACCEAVNELRAREGLGPLSGRTLHEAAHQFWREFLEKQNQVSREMDERRERERAEEANSSDSPIDPSSVGMVLWFLLSIALLGWFTSQNHSRNAIGGSPTSITSTNIDKMNYLTQRAKEDVSFDRLLSCKKDFSSPTLVQFNDSIEAPNISKNLEGTPLVPEMFDSAIENHIHQPISTHFVGLNDKNPLMMEELADFDPFDSSDLLLGEREDFLVGFSNSRSHPLPVCDYAKEEIYSTWATWKPPWNWSCIIGRDCYICDTRLIGQSMHGGCGMDGRRLGAILSLIGLVSFVDAAEPPAKFSGTIIMKEIEMRAGPSLKYPQTGVLQKGEQVLIAKEEEKWYAILPPPGSVSWVNHLFLGKYDPAQPGKQNAVIMKDNVTVRILGEFELDNNEKNRTPVVQMKLARGTIVEILADKRKFDDSTWYPIKPPAGEYRYIPKFAVGNLKEIDVPVSVAKNNVQVGNPNEKESPTPSNTAPSTTTAKVNHPSWGEAELLQARGQFAEAERVYTQIYQELKNKKADLDDLLTCLNRIDDCRQKVKPSTSSSIPRESTSRSASLENPTFRPSQPPPPQTRKDWPTARVVDDQNRNPEPDRGTFKSTGNGVLRRTPFLIDNKQAYALEKERGDVLYYVTAQSGVTLDSYLNKRVELLGTEQVRGDVRGAPYMVVSKVNPVK